ncbi:hypothetical protein RYX36_033076 [Vicia faba]
MDVDNSIVFPSKNKEESKNIVKALHANDIEDQKVLNPSVLHHSNECTTPLEEKNIVSDKKHITEEEELSETTIKVLIRKRNALTLQQRTIEDAIAMCNMKIHKWLVGEAGGSSPAVNENKAIAADSEEGIANVYWSQISNGENEGNYESLSVAERNKVIEIGGSSPALDGSTFPSENSFANEMPIVQATAVET